MRCELLAHTGTAEDSGDFDELDWNSIKFISPVRFARRLLGSLTW